MRKKKRLTEAELLKSLGQPQSPEAVFAAKILKL
jgi:hypothetical protein